VVVEVSPNLLCAAYTLSINPCGPPVQGTPTVTPTPPLISTPTLPVINTPTLPPANTATVTVISTATRTATRTVAPSSTPLAGTVTPTVCPVQFSDVDMSNPFY